ncbi:uncharacterized protein BDR25DRAFT_359453 [Lindgomyces ingoldianus]|uniref:Uncharacterized protein n=1 Tax=Lindgomyces ingoldianus TaxID=673940 RepID=A0ACB6QHT8_9PLEO|nr:uncharacterized protein BDR25DRAFT_359453 [Lindgomyces ingoldianus]KAF2466558.1 hypothetical protein BDR25DRAFT_359453 [Lindgomyces ingoldianus]
MERKEQAVADVSRSKGSSFYHGCRRMECTREWPDDFIIWRCCLQNRNPPFVCLDITKWTSSRRKISRNHAKDSLVGVDRRRSRCLKLFLKPSWGTIAPVKRYQQCGSALGAVKARVETWQWARQLPSAYSHLLELDPHNLSRDTSMNANAFLRTHLPSQHHASSSCAIYRERLKTPNPCDDEYQTIRRMGVSPVSLRAGLSILGNATIAQLEWMSYVWVEKLNSFAAEMRVETETLATALTGLG